MAGITRVIIRETERAKYKVKMDGIEISLKEHAKVCECRLKKKYPKIVSKL